MDEARRRFVAAIGVCVGALVVAMDWSVVNNALPSIQRSLGASLGELQWIMNIFGLTLAVFLVTMGRFGDAHGRKRLFLIGLVIFGAASIAAALSPSATFLILCRALQGFSMAIMMPCSQSLVTHAYPESMHAKAMGIWMTMVGVGISIGPAVGGIIVSLLSWHWIFYFNLPFVVLSYVLVQIFVSESKNEQQSSKMDFPGVTFLIVGIGSFAFSMIQAPEWGWDSPIIWGFLGLSVVGFIVFYFVEQHSQSPLVQFSLFKNRQFVAGALGAYTSVFLFWGIFFTTPLYLQSVRGFSPALSGVILLAQTVPFAFISHYAGQIGDRVGCHILVKIGLLIGLVGLLLMTFYQPQSPILLVFFALGLFGIASGLTFGPSISLGISALPRDFSGVASGGVTTVQEIGGVMGLALVGSLFRLREKSALMANLQKENVHLSNEAVEKIRSLMSSYDKVKAYLSQFSLETQRKVTEAFQESFIAGFNFGMWLCVAVIAAMIILIFLLLTPKRHTDSVK